MKSAAWWRRMASLRGSLPLQSVQAGMEAAPDGPDAPTDAVEEARTIGDTDEKPTPSRCTKRDKVIVVASILFLAVGAAIVGALVASPRGDNSESTPASNRDDADSAPALIATPGPRPAARSSPHTEPPPAILWMPTTEAPSSSPSTSPSYAPSRDPSRNPSHIPTDGPTSLFPTQLPTSDIPTSMPSPGPTPKPVPPLADQMAHYSLIGEQFFEDHTPNEASGLEVAPDRSHLVVVSDDGKLFFLNLLDYHSGHCVVDLDDDSTIDGRDDFEGVAIDTAEWRAPDEMYAYVVHEGSDDEDPVLFKIRYEFDSAAEKCNVSVVDEQRLDFVTPCLPGSNGLESLALKVPSTDTDPAVFYTGAQDTGAVYEITSEGELNPGSRCYNLGIDDLSASSFDGLHLWSYFGTEGQMAVVDVGSDGCPLASYDTKSSWDKEGLAIDFENGLMFLAVDNQGDDPSLVAVCNFTYPSDLDATSDFGSGRDVCGGSNDCNSCR